MLTKLFLPTVRKNCSSDREKLLKQNAFLTCSWRFLIPNQLEQSEFKLEKNIGIEKHAGKVRKIRLHWVAAFNVRRNF